MNEPSVGIRAGGVDEASGSAAGRDDGDPALGRRVGRGALWLAANSLFMRFANIAVMAIVARLLSPDDFGVFALALVAFVMITSVAELGVASAVARRDLDADSIAPTVTTFAIAAGALLAAALALFAEPIAAALGSVEATSALRILSISVALTGLFAVPGAQLQREFRQAAVFRASVVGFLVGTPALIGLALVGSGAEAFAWSRVLGQLATGIVMILGVSKRYRPGWNRSVIGMLLAFGLPLAGANLLSQAIVNVDTVVVGRTLDVAEVGIYTLVFGIASWSTGVLGSVLNGVVLPAFSAVRARGGDTTRALYDATRIVGLVAVPIAALTIALAGPLIETVYGPQWLSGADTLVVLAGYGLVSVIALLLANVIISTGRTIALLVVQGAVLLVLVPALVVGVSLWGLVGVGYAHLAVAACITFPVYLVAIRRATGAGIHAVFAGISLPLAAGALAALAAWTVATIPETPWLKLLAGGAAGGVVYLASLAPFYWRQGWNRLRTRETGRSIP